MLTSFLQSRLADFSKRYDYDTTYLQELAEADAGGLMKLALALGFTQHRFGLPAAVYFAAKVMATRHADCGSCVRLVVRMAEEAGVASSALIALLTGEGPTDPDMRFAADYARAVLTNDPALPEMVTKARAQWGERGMAGLAAATVSGMFYPLLKRGLGHGNACEPVIAMLRAETKGITHAAA